MFVIVNTQTGKEHKLKGWHTSAAVYDTERGAKTACTKLNKKVPGWEVMEIGAWHVLKALKFPVKMVKKINMMSGKEYFEAEDTPCYMSPACESYWSA
jgi:hypothetical protein